MANSPGLVAGMVLDWTGAESHVAKKTTGVITRGNVCVIDTTLTPDGYKKAPATAGVIGPHGMCNKTTLSADTEFSLIKGGIVALVSDGAIEVGKLVMTSGAVAGAVAVYAQSTVGATYAEAEIEAVAQDPFRIVGESLGDADAYNTKSPAASADTGLIAVRLRKV